MITDAERQDLLALLNEIEDTVGEAPCGQWPDGYHPEPFDSNALQKAVCKACPVRDMCLTYAVNWEVTGIWGGTTAQERQRMRHTLGMRHIDRRTKEAKLL